MIVNYHPEAADELLSTVEYYENKSVGLGADFLDEIEKAIAQIVEYPKSGSFVVDQNRRVLLNRYPYEIVYDVSEHVLLIIAIKHLHRKPGYWELRK